MRKQLYGGDTLFQIGDGIFYPMHGASRIESLEEKEILGKKQLYYSIKMLIGDMKVMIPKVQISKLNIRPVADLDSVKNIAKIFERNEDRESIPWKQRNKIFMDKIKSGDMQEIAEVIYSLLYMQSEDKLNTSERRMLDQAQKFLMSELKLVEGMSELKKDKFISKLTQDTVSLA